MHLQMKLIKPTTREIANSLSYPVIKKQDEFCDPKCYGGATRTRRFHPLKDHLSVYFAASLLPQLEGWHLL